MQVVDGELVVSATDLVGFLHCEHLAWLEKKAARGEIDKPVSDHPMLELLRAQGIGHEVAYLNRLRAEGLDVIDLAEQPEADVGGSGTSDIEKARRWSSLPRKQAADTRQAMQNGVAVLYQAALLDDARSPIIRGFADFLRRVDVPSDLGEWSYEPEDTKLSSHVSAWAVLQLCVYAQEVARLQGREPEHIHVVLGSGETVSIRLAEISAYFRVASQRFFDAVGTDPATDATETYPLPVAHCARCNWHGRCSQRWRNDDHLSQVAFMRMDQVRKFETAGITTMAALADQAPGLTVDGIGAPTVERLHAQARLQVATLPGEAPKWETVIPVEENLGLAMLPEPSAGDIFYDIEGHPYAEPGGLEYLHGYATVDTGSFLFQPVWAHDLTSEKLATERLIDMFTERLRVWPDMRVYHYAHYEVTALKKMVMRHGTREDELDDLLRAEVFVDLYKAVRQGMRIGVASYSIKRLEPLYMEHRKGEIGNGGSSIIEYDKWRNTGDQKILDEIEAYNRDDVESTWLLRAWLEDRRSELVASGTEVPRPAIAEVVAREPRDPETSELIGRLLDGVDVAEVERIRSATWVH